MLLNVMFVSKRRNKYLPCFYHLNDFYKYFFILTNYTVHQQYKKLSTFKPRLKRKYNKIFKANALSFILEIFHVIIL